MRARIRKLTQSHQPGLVPGFPFKEAKTSDSSTGGRGDFFQGWLHAIASSKNTVRNADRSARKAYQDETLTSEPPSRPPPQTLVPSPRLAPRQLNSEKDRR